MSLKKYELPETYEEGIKRKEEVLRMINEYNEALLSEQELPFTDEEIENLQEEYQILNDHLKLTQEEKVAKLDDDDVEIIDGVRVEKKTIWDKIHWSVYIYTILSTVILLSMTISVGDAIALKIVNAYFLKVYNTLESYYLTDELIMNKGLFMFLTIISYFILPIVICLLSLGFYLLFKKRNDINTKIAFITLMAHIVLTVIILVILLIAYIVKNWNAYYDNLSYYYYYWSYSYVNS